MTHTVMRCPNCKSSAHRKPGRTKFMCNFCQLYFFEHEGTRDVAKSCRGARDKAKPVQVARSGHIAPPMTIGRGYRWI